MKPKELLSLFKTLVVVAILIQELPIATSIQNCSDSGSTYFPASDSLPKSCQDVYSKYPQYHDKPGYYVVKSYCGMGYTGTCCEDIYTKHPETRDKPGMYRVKNQWVYCDMIDIGKYFENWRATCAGVDGGWTRIAHFNVSAGDNCPSGWVKDANSGVSFCRPPGSNPAGPKCYSVYFSTNGLRYNSVCGRARGYQKGNVYGFWTSTPFTIDGSYVAGLSITHGKNPRHHIWTYAVGQFDSPSVSYGCPCAPYKGTPPPSFVNSSYYCESGTTTTPSAGKYYFSDPLWDGLGCAKNNKCCSNKQQPWFHHNLKSNTKDDIEVRICISYSTYSAGAVVLDELELFIQ